MSRVTARCGVLVLILGLVPALSWAGNNAGGTVQLSWSSTDLVSNLSTAPTTSTPLYLLLSGTPDVQQLAVTLRWAPTYPDEPRYTFTPMVDAANCGWSAQSEDSLCFDDDCTYTWTIGFDDATPHTCVAYTVDPTNAASEPASFCISAVMITDSNGDSDDLAILGGATILGGVGDCPAEATDVFPTVAVPAHTDTLVVYGNNLTPQTHVALVNEGNTVTAQSVVQDAPGSVTATVEVPETFAGPVDVIVTTTQSSDTLSGRLRAGPLEEPAVSWQAEVTPAPGGPQLSVVTNTFATLPGDVFPVSHVLIRRCTDNSTIEPSGRIVPSFATDVASVTVDPQGNIGSGTLDFISSAYVSLDAASPRLTALLPRSSTPAGAVSSRWRSNALTANIPATQNDPFLGWEQSPDATWSVAHTLQRTLLLRRDGTALAPELPDRSFYGVFSKDASCFAAVRKDGRSVRWFILDRHGVPIREGEAVSGEVSQLQLSPNGQVLSFVRRVQHSAQSVAVNLATGQEAVLSTIPPGRRYYSADGRTLLVLVPNPSSLHLFDVTDPLRPTSLADPYESANARFITAAVSGDGSVIALQMVDPIDNPSGLLTRIVAFDRSLVQRATVSAQETAQGLQFEGRFLFVGVQRHPLPLSLSLQSTTKISVYDLSGM